MLVCENEDGNLEEEEVEQEEEAKQEENEDSGGSSSEIRSPASEDNNTAPESLVQGRDIRVRRKPIWMTNYVTRADLAEEEENFMMLMAESKNDPCSFEEAH